MGVPTRPSGVPRALKKAVLLLLLLLLHKTAALFLLQHKAVVSVLLLVRTPVSAGRTRNGGAADLTAVVMASIAASTRNEQAEREER